MTNVLTILMCGLMYRWGGTDQWKWCPINQKLWRRFIGIFLALAFFHHTPWAILCCFTYWLPDLFPYGEKSWLNFLGELLKFGVNGAVFGLASFPILGTHVFLQIFFAATFFMLIKCFDDANILKNPWVEFFRGIVGTICLLGVK